MKAKLLATTVVAACTLASLAHAQSSASAYSVQNGNTSITGTAVTDNASTAAAGDRQILNAIVAALAADPAMAGARIDVQVFEGRVTLSGVAVDTSQQQEARAIADSIAGAANVTNRTTTVG